MRRALMTVDLEDYRHHERERLTGVRGEFHPGEVTRQTSRLLDVFAEHGIEATFFTVGEIANRLPRELWARMGQGHRVGCHGFRHRHVRRMGREEFREDVRTGKAALEDAAGAAVQSYRAPYFSADGCDPWFGEGLADAGYRLDSSRRLPSIPTPGGVTTLPGAGEALAEVPLMSIGLGPKRITVIGGTYFRLMPLPAIERLLDRAHAKGFAPMVYLHPYDIDGKADRLEFSGVGLRGRLGDRIRHVGRDSVADKLAALTRTFRFQTVESLL